MKKISLYLYLVIVTLPLIIISCDGILDKQPKDTLTDASVWSSPEAIIAYLGKLYDNMPTEDLSKTVIESAGYPSQVTDEALRSYSWGIINDPIIPETGFEWWGYPQIREVNSFIEKIDMAPLPEETIRQYKAEARFIRAYYYFSMVKRYGGIPLITEVQEYTGSNIEELQIPRAKEKDIYEFVRTEIDEIANILNESWEAANRFKATKYSALALKSRAMLYAASSAKYAHVDLDGVVGIPASDADFYWEESRKASEAIMNSGKFQLYNEYENKEENFQYLFLDQTLHSETILTKVFTVPEKGHYFDFYNAPQTFKVDWGCVTVPVVELLESYDNIDGTHSGLPVNDASGKPILYKNPTDLFKDRDPRAVASVIVPFAKWHDGVVEVRRGIIDGNNIITSSNFNEKYGSGSNQISIIGKDGILVGGDPSQTGLYIKKFMNPNEIVPGGRSDTNWMIFRYGEILLNYAEACMELGQKDKALDAINQLRDRAGIARKRNLTLDDVRNERKVELAFENHRWWDLRRWRIADTVLNNTQFHALYPYLMWEEGKHPDEMSYTFRIEPAPKNTRTFLPKLYYVKIDPAQILTNPKLVQNPNY